MNEQQKESIVLPGLVLPKKEIYGALNNNPEGDTKGSFRKAGHLVDQSLKYMKKGEQLDLFNSLKPETQQSIELAGVNITEVVEGIKLSASEDKIINSLSKMLHSLSNTIDSDSDTYYSGNSSETSVVNYEGSNTIVPKLNFTLYELAKEYKGGEAVSGKDVENVRLILDELDNKRFLLRYTESSPTKDGGRVERYIEGYQKLITLVRDKSIVYTKENVVKSKKEIYNVSLHPIFRRQIESKYVTYPVDIIKRIKDAYGSHNLPESVMILKDYFLREVSADRFRTEINEENLLLLLTDKYVKGNRKKKAQEFTLKAIETMIKIGILEKFKISPNKTGGNKYVFELNKTWSK